MALLRGSGLPPSGNRARPFNRLRGYFTGEREVNCRTTADTLLTVAGGPLNDMGANLKVDCDVPEPSE